MYKQRVYGARLREVEKRRMSQSGGAFTAFAEYHLQNLGHIYGVVVNENNDVEFQMIDTVEALRGVKGSKYVQASLGDTFNQIRSELNESVKVLFCGTPCQVSGLLSFLRCCSTDMSNLITCDLICHGVPSPEVYKKFIEYIKGKRKSEIHDFRFRDKKYGWHSIIETYTAGGISYSSNQYARIYGGNNCLRPSCYTCKYSTINRVSDITIGDFWGIEKSRPEIDDNTGISLVIVNSSKGYEFFCKAREDMECFEATMDEALQPQLRHPTKKPDKSEEFWRDYKNRPFSYIVYKYGKGGATGIAKQLAINVLEKLRLYETLHSVWMKLKGARAR